MTILSARQISVRYPKGAWAVRQASFDVLPNELVAIVGESGCGKSTIAKTILGSLPTGSTTTGSLLLGATSLDAATARQWRGLRGNRVGYVSQDPFGAMNPLRRIRSNVAEAWKVKHTTPTGEALTAALDAVGVDQAAQRSQQYPHEWSGGMLQRAEIASSSVWEPELVVADEPTAALDADLADSIIDGLRKAAGSVLLISHDLALVSRHADRVIVMYGGRIVETGGVGHVLHHPRHPYTQGLLAAIPRPGRGLPTPLDGNPPDLTVEDPGCPFAPRCAQSVATCWSTTPELRGGVACPEVIL